MGMVMILFNDVNIYLCNILLAVFLQFRGVCDFTGEVGNIREGFRLPEAITIGADVGIGTAGSTITASVAVQLEGFSLVMVAYTLPNDGGNSVAIVR